MLSTDHSCVIFQFGMIVYSDDAILIFDLFDPVSDSVASLQAAIMAVDEPRNLTATPAGLLEAVNQFVNNDRDDAFYPDVVVTFTDGFANFPLIDPEGALMAAAENLQNQTG